MRRRTDRIRTCDPELSKLGRIAESVPWILIVKEQDSIKYSRSTVELYGTRPVAELNRSRSRKWSLLLKLSFGTN